MKVLNLGPGVKIHHFRLSSPREADRRLAALIRESYRVGMREQT